MDRTLPLLITFLLGLNLAACGTKGPLVLPEKSGRAETPATPQARSADDSKGGSLVRP